MICYDLAMGKQHLGPHVVVGYGIKIFWPGLFITSPDHLDAARVNVLRNAFYGSRSEKKFSDVDNVIKKSKCGLSRSVLLSTTSTRHYSFPINIFFVLFLHVERVCKRFWKESLTNTSSSFAKCSACSFKSESVFLIVSKSWQRFLSLSLMLL